MTNSRLILATLAGIAAIPLVVHFERRPEPVYFDMGQLISESAAGRAATEQLRRTTSGRDQAAAALAETAAKVTDPKEKAAKEQVARQEQGRAQQLNAADGQAADREFRFRVGQIVERAYPGRVAIPVVPVSGGTDVTKDLLARLDAANEDAENKLKAAQDQLAAVQKQLADEKARTQAMQAAPAPARKP